MSCRECKKCKTKKDLSSFPKEKGHYRHACKECRNEDKRKKYKTRKEIINEQNKKSYYKHKEERLKKYRENYANDPEFYRNKAKQWRKNNFKAYKSRQLKNSVGISFELYEKLLTDQKNKCRICTRKVKVLCVDHCHSTGKIRGLLCGNCNLGLGNFKDNKLRLKNAIKYLEDNK